MVPPELSFVIEQFNREHFAVSTNWITACVEWCKTEFQDSCRTRQSLMLTARSQWLDTDLRAEGVQTGPQLRTADLHPDKLKAPEALKGTYNLQLLG